MKACVVLKEGFGPTLGWTQDSTPNMAVVQVRFRNRTLFLTSAYVEPDVDARNTLGRLDDFLKSHLDAQHIIGMDGNGKHVLWNCDDNDGRGESIATIASTNNLDVLNVGRTPTFESVTHGRYCCSIPDVTLASNNIADSIQRWTVNQDACQASDHNAIDFTISASVAGRPGLRTSTYYFNNKTANWAKFQSSLRHEMESSGLLDLSLENLSPDDLDDTVCRMTHVIRTACTATMKIRGSGRQVNPWWTPELQDLKQKCIRLHHRLNQQSRGSGVQDSAAAEHRRAKLDYAKAVKKTSGRHFRDFCSRQGKENVWTLTNRLIKDAPKQQPPSTLQTSTGFTSSSEETASALLRHFYPDDDADVRDEQIDLRQQEHLLSSGADERPFVPDEVRECLRTMNPNRAPGHDNLTSDICSEFADAFPDFLTGLFNRCLDVGHFPSSWKDARVKIIQKPGKDDYTSLSSFRPIGLLPIFGKLLEKLFIKRMTFRALQERTWNGRQFGFKEQTSTTDALRTLIEKIKSARKLGRHVIGVSLDIKAAFDNAWWPALMERLRRTQCPRNIHRLIKSYLSGRTVTLDLGDARASKSMTKGCVQGSVCGPTFWNLILDDLLDVPLPYGCHIQAYADDVMLLVDGRTVADVQMSANQALASILDWGRSVKLSFSPAKTQAIAFNRASKQASITMDGVEVPFRPDIRLLGVVLDEHLSFIKHAKCVISKVTRTFRLLCKFVRPTWGVHPENVEILYHHVIVPTVTYASGIWGSAAERPSVRRLLQSFNRTFAITCIRGFHTVSAVAATALAGFMPLHLKVREVRRIEDVKWTRTFEGLPVDQQLESRVRPDDLLHPADRLTICSDSAETQEQVDSLARPTSIYTDGSKLESGDTGCAFVVFHPSGRQESFKFRLDSACTVFQAELFALSAAVDWTSRHATSDVTVFTDSQSSAAALSDRSNKHPLVTAIHHKLHQVSGILDVRFVWVRAHVGIVGNEAADVAAKEAACSPDAPSYSAFPLSFAKHIIRSDAADAWEQEYASASTGSTTRSFFPTIASIKKFRSSVQPSFEWTQLLTGHGFHLQYLHRFKIASSETCPCGLDVQDVHHLLTSCPRYASQTLDFAVRCERRGVRTLDFLSISNHPDLLDSLSSIVNSIVRTLKSFNSSI